MGKQQHKTPPTDAPPGHASKGDISNMLGVLKYKADALKNKKGHGMVEAQAALAHYSALPCDKKQEFLLKFKKEGHKNLDWVMSLTETEAKTDEVVDSMTEGMMNKYQIFELNGMRWADFPTDEAQVVLTQLIKDSEATFEFTSATDAHPVLPALNKYQYKFLQARKRKHVETECSVTTNATSGAGESVQKALKATAALPPGGTTLKLENKHLAEVKEQVVALKSGKAALERSYNQGSDLQAQLALKGLTDQAIKMKADEVEKAMEAMHTFMTKTLRAQIAMCDAATGDMDLEAVPKKNQEIINVALAHKDGWQAMHKRYKAFLG